MTDKIPLTTRIEVDFAEPVEITSEQQQQLMLAIGSICSGYEASHPERTMWPMGIGGKCDCIWDDEPNFDMSILHIECAERERYDTDRRNPAPSLARKAANADRLADALGELAAMDFAQGRSGTSATAYNAICRRARQALAKHRSQS
jgi:hypothetical protein